VVGLEWYPYFLSCVLEIQCGWVAVVSVLQAEALCVFSLQHGYHSNPTVPNLQHTTNQEQYDQCGNWWYPLQPNHTETPTHNEPRTI